MSPDGVAPFHLPPKLAAPGCFLYFFCVSLVLEVLQYLSIQNFRISISLFLWPLTNPLCHVTSFLGHVFLWSLLGNSCDNTLCLSLCLFLSLLVSPEVRLGLWITLITRSLSFSVGFSLHLPNKYILFNKDYFSRHILLKNIWEVQVGAESEVSNYGWCANKFFFNSTKVSVGRRNLNWENFSSRLVCR